MESQSNIKASTEESKLKANAPPEVITVDTQQKVDGPTSDNTPPKLDPTSQARTPKHANKSHHDEEEEENDDKQAKRALWGAPPASYGSSYFDQQRMGGSGGGAFQAPPRDDSNRYTGHPPPMQVSPGGGRYYYGNGGGGSGSGGRYYDQRYSADFSHAPSYPHRYPPMYPPHQQSSQQYYDSRWYGHGQRPPEHYYRGNHNNNPNFSRAVSGSFDRSIKSAPPESKQGHGHRSPKPPPPSHPTDNASIPDDASWGQLKQVHSVDEDEMRRRLAKRKEREGRDDKDVVVKDPTSNSSSLTNSPTENVERLAAKKRELGKSSGDSISSVASGQDAMDSKKAPSPDDTAPSLELLKCPSGTSTLLLPSHQRSLSQFSLSGMESKDNSDKKDLYDTEREIEHKVKAETKEPASKKARLELPDDKKESPLSIVCSPPTTPGGTKKKPIDPKMHQPQAIYPSGKESSPGFFDKAPSYTYSMESAPQMPRDSTRHEHYPPVPRPGSSASSTITPMNVDAGDMRGHPPAVGQIPSWEIQPQDSFGATSTGGGHPLMGSFSFQQDYQTLAPSASGDQGHGHFPPPPPPHVQHTSQPLESRNQSFEGGHFHGSFSRNDSMMSYEGRQMSFDGHGRPPYQGSFPPHAPSWGSAGSYPAAPYGHGQRPGYPPMMRNYSEDSGRASPPPGGMRMMPPSFPPPPEFRAPPPSLMNKSGSQNTIMTSPYQASPKIGPFGWSKEEDARLTEIMKKYKNPRDWEPIAKEHGRGRSAKECHERWIRYLKPGVRKGQWTDHEDAIVMEAVTTSAEQPFTRWSDLAQRLPGRVGKQIRDRWVNHLNPAINHLPFSREDDLKLWEGHKSLGKRWVEISTKFFNNTRSENHIKNRWYSASFKKFIANEFGPDAYNGGKTLSKKESPKKKVPKPTKGLDPSQIHSV